VPCLINQKSDAFIVFSSGIERYQTPSVSQLDLTKTVEQLMVRTHRPRSPCLRSLTRDDDSGLFNLGFGWVEVGSVTPKPQVRDSPVHAAHAVCTHHDSYIARQPAPARFPSSRRFCSYQPLWFPFTGTCLGSFTPPCTPPRLPIDYRRTLGVFATRPAPRDQPWEEQRKSARIT
jgi:hypothetical protein